MTGSTSALIVIPIVAFISLAVFLIMVFWADNHPQNGRRTPNRELTGGKPGGGLRQQIPRHSAAPDELTDTSSQPAAPNRYAAQNRAADDN